MFVKPKIGKIKKRRRELNLSQHQTSISSGIGASSLSRIESGNTKAIHILRARQIAKTLNCELSDLFENKKGEK